MAGEPDESDASDGHDDKPKIDGKKSVSLYPPSIYFRRRNTGGRPSYQYFGRAVNEFQHTDSKQITKTASLPDDFLTDLMERSKKINPSSWKPKFITLLTEIELDGEKIQTANADVAPSIVRSFAFIAATVLSCPH